LLSPAAGGHDDGRRGAAFARRPARPGRPLPGRARRRRGGGRVGRRRPPGSSGSTGAAWRPSPPPPSPCAKSSGPRAWWVVG